MAFAPKRLCQFVASTTETSTYTVPASTFTIVKNVVVANNNPSSVSVSLSVVPTGQVAGYSNRILPGVSIPANTAVPLDVSIVMATGDFISCSATVGGAVTVTVSGVEESGNALSSGGTAAPAQTGLTVVTSTTRPASPFVGQFIFESDTYKQLVWNGYSWQSNAGVPVTLGYAELTSSWTASGVGNAEADVTGLTVTVTVPAGRRIKVSGIVHLRSTVAGDQPYSRIRMDGSNLGFIYANELATSRASSYVETVLSPAAGTHTFKVTATNPSGTGTASVYSAWTSDSNKEASYILVEDITGDPMPVAVNSVPVGLLAQMTYPGGNVTLTNFPTLITIPGFSLSFTVPAGRVVRLAGYIMAYSSTTVSEEVTGYQLYDNGVQVPGSGLGFVTGPNWGAISTFDIAYSPSAGAHVITMQARRDSGAGTHTFQGGHLQAEDISPTPASASSAPSSTLGYGAISSGPTISTTEVDLPGATATVTVAAGRRLKITGRMAIGGPTAANNELVLWLSEDGVKKQHNVKRVINVSDAMDFHVEWSATPSAGTHTYKLSGQVTVGSGQFVVSTASDRIGYILVEDVTPASVYPVPISNGLAIVTSSTRPGVTSEGLAIYETDTDNVMVWNATEWRRLAPPGVAVARQLQSAGSTSSATYVDMPNAVSLSVVKRSASTSLLITVAGSTYVNTTTGMTTQIAVQINGVDVDLCYFFHNAIGRHDGFAATTSGFAGLAAGTYTAKLRWRMGGAGGSLNVDANDLYSLTVQEMLGM